jgi:hypothetical protein
MKRLIADEDYDSDSLYKLVKALCDNNSLSVKKSSIDGRCASSASYPSMW